MARIITGKGKKTAAEVEFERRRREAGGGLIRFDEEMPMIDPEQLVGRDVTYAQTDRTGTGVVDLADVTGGTSEGLLELHGGLGRPLVAEQAGARHPVTGSQEVWGSTDEGTAARHLGKTLLLGIGSEHQHKSNTQISNIVMNDMRRRLDLGILSKDDVLRLATAINSGYATGAGLLNAGIEIGSPKQTYIENLRTLRLNNNRRIREHRANPNTKSEPDIIPTNDPLAVVWAAMNKEQKGSGKAAQKRFWESSRMSEKDLLAYADHLDAAVNYAGYEKMPDLRDAEAIKKWVDDIGFKGRRQVMEVLMGKNLLNKYGIRVPDMERILLKTTEPSTIGLPEGTILSAIETDASPIVRTGTQAESFPYAIHGRALGSTPPMNAELVFDQFQDALRQKYLKGKSKKEKKFSQYVWGNTMPTQELTPQNYAAVMKQMQQMQEQGIPQYIAATKVLNAMKSGAKVSRNGKALGTIAAIALTSAFVPNEGEAAIWIGKGARPSTAKSGGARNLQAFQVAEDMIAQGKTVSEIWDKTAGMGAPVIIWTDGRMMQFIGDKTFQYNPSNGQLREGALIDFTSGGPTNDYQFQKIMLRDDPSEYYFATDDFGNVYPDQHTYGMFEPHNLKESGKIHIYKAADDRYQTLIHEMSHAVDMFESGFVTLPPRGEALYDTYKQLMGENAQAIADLSMQADIFRMHGDADMEKKARTAAREQQVAQQILAGAEGRYSGMSKAEMDSRAYFDLVEEQRARSGEYLSGLSPDDVAKHPPWRREEWNTSDVSKDGVNPLYQLVPIEIQSQSGKTHRAGYPNLELIQWAADNAIAKQKTDIWDENTYGDVPANLLMRPNP